jgi:hypothetical protein
MFCKLGASAVELYFTTVILLSVPIFCFGLEADTKGYPLLSGLSFVFVFQSALIMFYFSLRYFHSIDKIIKPLIAKY